MKQIEVPNCPNCTIPTSTTLYWPSTTKYRPVFFFQTSTLGLSWFVLLRWAQLYIIIVLKITDKYHVRKQELNLAVVLACVVAVFSVCHIPRLILIICWAWFLYRLLFLVQILVPQVLEQRLTFRFRNFCQIFEGFGFGFGKFGFGKKSRFRFRKNLVSEKSLGFGIAKNLVSEKSLGFGFGKFGLGKKSK